MNATPRVGAKCPKDTIGHRAGHLAEYVSLSLCLLVISEPAQSLRVQTMLMQVCKSADSAGLSL